MDNYQLESELQHLERVLARMAAEHRFPLSYWRTRLNAVLAARLVPSQRSRASRLDELLRALEARAPAVGC
ncbi:MULTISPECIES: hypothetical protein [Paraburkholderia]|jgi:hypothetical protein|uniref:Uncharacterized protein n=2 Tax=Paraburkholderia TaxID=1822464 RepID=A0A7Z7BFA9_9BURK|nr:MULTISPECIES: hypothetical protein [Paraburkholderia]SKC90677.1 hypothetical protein SAMN05445504_6017 [Burkholderia sp. CF099]SOE90914.1 hypothetical protein SAMN05446935_10233 [Burkholderia sp. YR290]AUT62550.1 hypothetical protein C2L65_23315 [Paraburkholderia terrae]SDJ10539.1 hypothetical protein SAMN04487926_13359 [Paraburkholderia steynii]SKC92735.1 hypothetical protein SAMN05446934_6229 [Paraburkholderia hospita]